MKPDILSAVVWIFVCPPQNAHAEILTSKVADGAFGRCSSHKGGTLVNGISAV